MVSDPPSVGHARRAEGDPAPAEEEEVEEAEEAGDDGEHCDEDESEEDEDGDQESDDDSYWLSARSVRKAILSSYASTLAACAQHLSPDTRAALKSGYTLVECDSEPDSGGFGLESLSTRATLTAGGAGAELRGSDE